LERLIADLTAIRSARKKCEPVFSNPIRREEGWLRKITPGDNKAEECCEPFNSTGVEALRPALSSNRQKDAPQDRAPS
jgi:hypothetical protein